MRQKVYILLKAQYSIILTVLKYMCTPHVLIYDAFKNVYLNCHNISHPIWCLLRKTRRFTVDEAAGKLLFRVRFFNVHSIQSVCLLFKALGEQSTKTSTPMSTNQKKKKTRLDILIHVYISFFVPILRCFFKISTIFFKLYAWILSAASK